MSSQIMLLTGCASGIGRHLTGALSARGTRLLATDLDEAALGGEAVARRWDPARVALHRLDVRREDDWEAALDAAARVHGSPSTIAVMNIAGYLQPAYVADIATRDVDHHFDVNAKGVVLGTSAAARRMIPARAGHIINIGSLASLAPVPGLSLYCASKFAVRGFTLAAALEPCARHGVAVTLVMPDAVETPMLDKQVDYAGGGDDVLGRAGPRRLRVTSRRSSSISCSRTGRWRRLTPLSRAILATALPARRPPRSSAWRRPCCGRG